jgi:DNA-binding response OmpR family regulator
MIHTVLLVEDDENIMKINQNKLIKSGYRVLTAEKLSEAETVLENETPDLIVLDIMLPDGDGISWCRKIRGESQEPPILFLSAKNESTDILDALKSGGDDYLTKPYDLDIFAARVEILLKKASRIPKIVKKGSLTLEIASQRVFLHGEDMLLTQKEFAVLLIFIQNENRNMTPEYLYEKAWGQLMNNNANAIRTQVSRLRAKLENSEFIITSLRGEGYCFKVKRK